MLKAAILTDSFNNPAPSAKDIQNYLKKSANLLYGNDKRKTKSTPLIDKFHLVDRAYTTFSEAICTQISYRYKLYIFDDKINSVYFHLKYAPQILCHFKLDEAIADQMHNASWSYEHLQRFRKGLEQDISHTNFFKQKGIGSQTFHSKSVPKFTKDIKAFILSVEKEISALEQDAVMLFKSGWD